MSLTFTFGKYEDQTLESVAEEDPKYLLWLIDQDWFTEKHQEMSAWIEENRERLEDRKWRK